MIQHLRPPRDIGASLDVRDSCLIATANGVTGSRYPVGLPQREDSHARPEVP